VGKLGSFALKRILLLAPVLALGACTTDDLESFAAGLNMAAYELENELNPPCPGGMYRQFVPDSLVTSYPQYAYQQVGYTLTPGGYSYCAFPVAVPYSGDDHGRGHRGRRGDNDYRDGYRDGYRDAERDDRRD